MKRISFHSQFTRGIQPKKINVNELSNFLKCAFPGTSSQKYMDFRRRPKITNEITNFGACMNFAGCLS